MTHFECPLCENEALYRNDPNSSVSGNFACECKRCGTFRGTTLGLSSLSVSCAPEEKSLLAGAVRERTDLGLDPLSFVNHESITEHLVGAPKRVSEKALKLLAAIERRTKQFGQHIELNEAAIPWAYASNETELIYLTKHLCTLGWVSSCEDETFEDFGNYVVSPLGFEILETRAKARADSSEAFVAMWFHNSVNEAFWQGLAAAISDCGYRPVRIDLEQHNDCIVDRIIAAINESRFVVADFTGHRNGVYYEAGRAEGQGIPLIRTCRADAIDDAHFDIKHMNIISWSTPAELRERLKNRILATIGRGPEKPVLGSEPV